MRRKNKLGDKIKGLALIYSEAAIRLSWAGESNPLDQEKARTAHEKAKQNLFDEIDRLISQMDGVMNSGPHVGANIKCRVEEPHYKDQQ
jgi:hypothetical protein